MADRRQLLAWSISALVLVAYALLPSNEASTTSLDDEESGLSISSISPPDPYPGSSLLIRHNATAAVRAYAGKVELRVLARHPGELVARLPTEAAVGDLKIRLTSEHDRSKPFHVRVKAPNWRKVFRSLLGGVALVGLGIALMARGVRASTGLSAARAVTRMATYRGVAYGLGALTGAFAQSTTSAAGILAALTSSYVLPVSAAALAFLGAQLGATLAPLLVAGLVEPREGLIAIVIGSCWLALASDRRAQAIGRLLLGAGFVAYGLQLFRPGLEPFFSDPSFLSLADDMRTGSAYELLGCALIGSVLVAALQGPAPLVVLILGFAHTTGRWDLTTALALLSGTGFGASLAALITSSGGPLPRALARLNLMLGALSTLLCASTVLPFARAAQWFLDTPMLGAELALAFVPSQLCVALVLATLSTPLARWLEARRPAPRPNATLTQILALQQAALDSTAVLAQTGARAFGQRAEHTLATARASLEQLVSGPGELARFSCMQLQQALETLLARAEGVTDARLVDAAREPVLPWDDDLVLRELHVLVSEGLTATRESLTRGSSLDLDSARAREIEINRLEARARSALLELTPRLVERHLHVLQVIDAYEVVGNQLYRLAESVGDVLPSHA